MATEFKTGFSMQIFNATPFKEHTLRRCIEWTCGQLLVPASSVRIPNFYALDRSLLHETGCKGSDISIGINVDRGPTASVLCKTGETFRLPDMNSLLVWLVAHEVAHIREGRCLPRDRRHDRQSEQFANARARECLQAFYENELELTWLWYRSEEEESWDKHLETPVQAGTKKTRLIDLE